MGITKLGFIGMGNMASAILSGIVAAKLPVQIYACDVDSKKLEDAKSLGVVPCVDAIEVVSKSEALMLAVKPQSIPELLLNIKEAISKDQLIISIAAGITPSYIASQLCIAAKVVQVMPNTPLMLSCGATALARGEGVSDKEFEFAKSLFALAGIAEEIPLDKMNEIIPINGSSPAFIYEYAGEFIKYGKSVGLSQEVCLKLFAQTLIGSARMLTESGYSIAQLIDMVSSKGGTTIAGLSGLRECGISTAVDEACKRAVNRAYELSK